IEPAFTSGLWRADQAREGGAGHGGSERGGAEAAGHPPSPPAPRRRAQPIYPPGGPAAPPGGRVVGGPQPGATPPRVGAVVGVQELGLELGHVHVAGALRLARLAHQAEVHNLVDPALADVTARGLRVVVRAADR